MTKPLGYQSFTQHAKETKRGLLISNDWVKDLCRLGERSLTTGIAITHPKRYLRVLKGLRMDSCSLPTHFLQSINQSSGGRHLLNAREK